MNIGLGLITLNLLLVAVHTHFLLFTSASAFQILSPLHHHHHHHHHSSSCHLNNNNNLRAIRVRNWSTPTRTSTSSTRLAISNLFNNDNTKAPQLPKDVKEAVSKCRESVQKGLENKLSRMVRYTV